jgi:hypothetical protein
MRSLHAFGKPGGMEYVRGPVESEAKWQKRVMTALWISLALVLATGTALVFAEAHGWFDSAPALTTRVPAWPAGP